MPELKIKGFGFVELLLHLVWGFGEFLFRLGGLRAFICLGFVWFLLFCKGARDCLNLIIIIINEAAVVFVCPEIGGREKQLVLLRAEQNHQPKRGPLSGQLHEG